MCRSCDILHYGDGFQRNLIQREEKTAFGSSDPIISGLFSFLILTVRR